MKINLRNVTLVTIIFDEEVKYLEATLPVLRYMQSIADYGRITLFTALPVPEALKDVEIVRIPPTDLAGVTSWLSGGVRLFIRTPYMMYFQDDGFILEPSLWEPEFLNYDFIGAPWSDGLVGNSGFSIQSLGFLWAMGQIPWDGKDGYDWFYCRTQREAMLKLGIRFAPTEVAARFSSEQRNQNDPSLGYHGRGHNPTKHAVGQEKIARFIAQHGNS